MYCGDIYQLNSEPGRGRRWGHIGFVSAAVELVRTWTCCGRAAVELFASPEDAWRALWALLGEALLARRAGGGPDFGAFVKWSKRLAASGFDKQLGRRRARRLGYATAKTSHGGRENLRRLATFKREGVGAGSRPCRVSRATVDARYADVLFNFLLAVPTGSVSGPAARLQSY